MSMSTNSSTQLRPDAIGVWHVVFFVVAAAAPLTAVVGASPAAFAFGNGAGTPGTYLIVGLLYLLFSVGFTAMNRFVGTAGGFYPYIANGLGRPAGVAGAFIAIATYNAIDIAVYGLFGFFVADMVKSAGGPDIHWLFYAALLGIAVFLCGMRNIEFSGKLLGYCMVAEIAILLLLGLAILIGGGGPEGVTLSAFGPQAIFAPGFGVSLVFVVASFIGFEATAIFGEEARDPKRTIPRATYLAVIVIAVFYAFATWTVALNYGPSNIAAEATANTATLYLTAIQTRLGPLAGLAMNLLLITSLFACALSFHNTINRYFYAIGREGLVWAGFARTHADHQSPYVAGAVQSVIALGAAALFALGGQDPYAVVFAWMGTFASIGILVVQILVSLAVIGFFRADARGVGIGHRLVAPALSIVGLGACLAFMIANLSLVSGSESPVVNAFPVLVVAIGVAGYVFARWLRSVRPAVYENLGRAFG
ncbi:APC family permease [Roseixanthobacter liquoris]|uniref:APC family permease n=1 Tax=Roseixanthobacter liquoris TaxID=3119921 RepID=UPI0037275A85